MNLTDQSKVDQTAQEEHQGVTKAKSGAAHEAKSPQVSWCKNSITIGGKTHPLPTTKQYILHEYADVFKGIGTLPGGPYHIQLKGSYKPVQHPLRSVPLGMQSAYKAELDRLVKEGIITEVHEHTEWINSIVPVIVDVLSRVCPLQSYPTPSLPWHTVATDLFKLKILKYLLVVDYYNRFPILCKLTSTVSKVLIQELKAIFTKMGVPNTIVSDGGPQYTSAEFRDFMKDWQIEHKVSSSRTPQSNGMAERCVRTMKASLLKTIGKGEDVNLALLTYKTTPLNHSLPSPAELLNSRKYKALLPTCIVPTRLQAEYKQIMDHGKQM